MTRNLKLTTLSAAIGLAAVASAPLAPATEISTTGTGTALIVPYYTVRDGWITTLNLTNTSDDYVAVKVRFREHKNSRDVLDFTIVMSPLDVWTGYLSDTPDGPMLRSKDKSCTSPLTDLEGFTLEEGWLTSAAAYTIPYEDFGGDGVGRMRQGYVEVLAMGKGEAVAPTNGAPGNVPYYAKHVSGVPRDCNIVNAAFGATADQWEDGTNPLDYNGTGALPGLKVAGSGDPLALDDFSPMEAGDNPLKANVSWLQIGTGAGAGTTALAISDWGVNQQILTAQQFPWFLEPTLATATLWTVTNLDDIEAPLSATNTINEWANNTGEGGTGAQTDMVITFPTKAFHVDWFNDQIQAAVSQYRNGNAPVLPVACDTDRTAANCPDQIAPISGPQPFEAFFGLDAAVGDGDSPITIKYNVCDREETCATVTAGGPTVSPAPPGEVEQIRYEANVIQLSDESKLSSPTATAIDAAGLVGGAKNGWVDLEFSKADPGLPVLGFVIKVRDQGETGSNYGQAMDNAYVRPAAPDNGVTGGN